MSLGYVIVHCSSQATGIVTMAGVILLLIAQALYALVLVLQEKLLDNTGIDEVSEVGLCGVGSFATALLMMPFDSKIKCMVALCKY